MTNKPDEHYEALARLISASNRALISTGKAYVNDNEKHKPFVEIVK